MFKKIVLLLIVVYSTLFFSAFSFSGVESVNVQHESGVQVIDIRRSDDVISKENIDMDFEKLTKVDTSSENSLDEALNIMRRDPFAAIKFIQENEELANK
ncbi:hypothetical protein [Endozoicomonas sp. Mp262]|uniref:hypothetical protein n=1 Tax=Endozoicomonas sp. Mp262 TaxID=2919499 RepID=UPI0021D95BF4